MIKTADLYIKTRYGSKRGFLSLYYSKVTEIFGCWNTYKEIDWNIVETLVFICMGNICRSPLGEVAANSSGIKTHSFGLTAPSGDPADPRAIDFAKKLNLDLSEHKTTSIKEAKFLESDLIICMEPQHYHHPNFPINCLSQKTLLGLWLEKTKPYLHDPYNTNDEYFYKCENMVIEATNNLVKKFIESRQTIVS